MVSRAKTALHIAIFIIRRVFPMMIVDDEWLFSITVVQIFHLQRGNPSDFIDSSLQMARLNIFFGGGQFLTNRVKVIMFKVNGERGKNR